MLHKSVSVPALAGLLVLPAVAQENSTNAPVRLPEVVVTATRLPDETVALEKYPANVTVLTRKEIEASPAATILDLMRQATGVFYSDTVGFSQSGTKLNMRGYSDKPGALILVDGVRVSDAGDGTFLWNSVPLADIERIEIIRGGSSTIYGEGAIAGVVNIITKHASERPFSFEATGAGGNLGYYRGNVEASGTQGAFSYRLGVSREAWDGWRDASGFRSWAMNAAPSVNTAAGRFTLSYRYFENSSEDPGNLTLTQFNSNPRQQGASQTFSTNWVHRAALTYEKEINDQWNVLSQFYGQTYDSHTESTGFAQDTRQPNFGATLQTTWKSKIAGRENTLTFGSEGVSQDFHQISNFSTSLVDYWTASGFVQDTLELSKRLTFTAGARFDHREWHVTAFDPFGTYNFDQDKFADVWSAKSGLNYKFADKSDGWLSVSRAFRLPGGSDISAINYVPPFFTPVLLLPNPNIQPVDARTVEGGVRSDFSKWLGGSLCYYFSDVKNDIVFDPFTFQNANFDSRKQGVELGLHSKPAEWIGLYVNTAWTDARFNGGTHDGKTLPHIADWQVSEGVNFYPAKNWTLTIEALQVIDQVVLNDLDNMLPRNTYTVLNTKAAYNYKAATLFSSVNNLLDTRYELFPTSNGTMVSRKYNPAPGINFQLGVALRF